MNVIINMDTDMDYMDTDIETMSIFIFMSMFMLMSMCEFFYAYLNKQLSLLIFRATSMNS